MEEEKSNPNFNEKIVKYICCNSDLNSKECKNSTHSTKKIIGDYESKFENLKM